MHGTHISWQEGRRPTNGAWRPEEKLVAVKQRPPAAADLYAKLIEMARKTGSTQKATKAKRQSASSRQPASALLVIECRAKKLAADGLAVGQSVCDLVRSFHPKIKIELIQTSTTPDLQRTLGELGQKHSGFRVMLLIGHSNETGIQWTDDQFLTWPQVAAWLNYFAPTSVFLTACDAGRLPVARQLFGAMPTLKRVYGSPTKLRADQNHPIVMCALDELGHRGLTTEGRQIIQGLSLLLTRGLMFRWTRKDVFGTGRQMLKSVGQDLAARLFDRFAHNF